jgi:formylglycine-generating enzyme required for sulfatase activity/serine/threonine protein kinase
VGDSVLEGRYELKKRLGQGGMGAVYEARHIFLKTVHAIKVILPEFLVSNDPEFVRRFRQEAMAAANIRHPNVIRVTDYGVANGSTPFLVMDFIRGRLLQEILAQEKRLAPERSLEMMEPIMAGVGAAHRLGIVHRDLKPLNIIIEDDLPLRDAVKVLDFGLAKIKTGELLGSFVAAKSSGVMGSPPYMAPEQWSDEEFDSRSDIYSLGIILYQMLTGTVPFKGPSAPSIMKKHLMDEPPPFIESGVSVPPRVEAVVRHALEKSPADRPQSVYEFIGELRTAIHEADTVHERIPPIITGSQADTFVPPTAEVKIAPSHTFDDAETVPHDSGAEQLHEAEAAARLAEAEEHRQRLELERVTAEEEQRRAREEAERKRAEEERAEEEARAAEKEEARRHEAEEAARAAAEERRRKEEEQQRAREEKERRKREIEAARLAEEERRREELRKLAEEAERQRREEEARKLAEEEARRLAEEEEARKLAEEEAERLRKEEEARQKAAEVERRQEAERKRQEEEAKRQAEARAAEKKRREQEEEEQRAAARALELERVRLEEEKRRRLEEEEAERKRAEEERAAAEEEARRLEADAAARAAAEERQREEQRRAREEEERRGREVEAARLAEEERRREQRQLADEAERQRQEAEGRRAAEEAHKRAAQEARRRAEEVERRRREEEAQRAAEAERRRGEEEARRRAANEAKPKEVKQTLDVRRGAHPAPSPSKHPDGEAKTSRVPVIALAAAVVLLGLAGILYLLFRSNGQRVGPANRGINNGTPAAASRNASSSNQAQTPDSNRANSDFDGKQPYRPELVEIPGGRFLMGRNDVSTPDAFTQYPAHEVVIKPFLIDRTEVTNAEYAVFVRETHYRAPDHWKGDTPPAKEEMLPVANVSFQDAQAFAKWRSKRDGVTYRLPREEEWEFAARGSRSNLYPWGNEWADDRVNLQGNGPRPVGSYPQGATDATGVLDMIGNVWEWTSSESSLYPGNDKRELDVKGWIVVRGGSYLSMADNAVKKRGSKEFPATWRQWQKKDTRNPTLGFRLVRDLP